MTGAELCVWLHGAVPAVPDGMLACASAAEQAQAQRFVRAADRIQRLAASAYRRMLLGQALDCAPAALRFSTEPLGKPRLLPPDGRVAPEFNVSHCAGAIAVAIGAAPLGVDVEFAGGSGFDWDLLELCFNRAERAAIGAAAAAERNGRAFALWTIKEALLKATGQGLQLAPLEVDSGVAAGASPYGVRQVEFGGRQWRVETRVVGGQWLACVATPAGAGAVRWQVGAHGTPPGLRRSPATA